MTTLPWWTPIRPWRHLSFDTGARESAPFAVHADEPLWLYVDYVFLDPDNEGVTWGGDEEPGPALFIHVSDEVRPIS